MLYGTKWIPERLNANIIPEEDSVLLDINQSKMEFTLNSSISHEGWEDGMRVGMISLKTITYGVIFHKKMLNPIFGNCVASDIFEFLVNEPEVHFVLFPNFIECYNEGSFVLSYDLLLGGGDMNPKHRRYPSFENESDEGNYLTGHYQFHGGYYLTGGGGEVAWISEYLESERFRNGEDDLGINIDLTDMRQYELQRMQ